MVAKIKMTKDGPEQPFTFAFVEYSKEPVSTPTSAPAATTTASAAASKPAPPAASTSAPRRLSSSCRASRLSRTANRTWRGPTRCCFSDSLPKNSKALLTLLSMCSDEVQKLVQGAQFGFVYQPTMLGKDIALALENYLNEVPNARRAQASDAIRKTVLAAWQLDMYGDMGNQEKITEAFTHFAAAIAAVKTAYAPQP